MEILFIWYSTCLAEHVEQREIRELRNKYEKELGSKFKLADFHDELLKDGCMPLETLEKKMDAWAARMGKS